MSVSSQITRIQNNVANAYATIEEMGGTMPETLNSANLASAIASIPTNSCPFPIGSIYLSMENTNPSTFWSYTTWGKIDNKMLIGQGNIYATSAVYMWQRIK